MCLLSTTLTPHPPRQTCSSTRRDWKELTSLIVDRHISSQRAAGKYICFVLPASKESYTFPARRGRHRFCLLKCLKKRAGLAFLFHQEGPKRIFTRKDVVSWPKIKVKEKQKSCDQPHSVEDERKFRDANVGRQKREKKDGTAEGERKFPNPFSILMRYYVSQEETVLRINISKNSCRWLLSSCGLVSYLEGGFGSLKWLENALELWQMSCDNERFIVQSGCLCILKSKVLWKNTVWAELPQNPPLRGSWGDNPCAWWKGGGGGGGSRRNLGISRETPRGGQRIIFQAILSYWNTVRISCQSREKGTFFYSGVGYIRHGARGEREVPEMATGSPLRLGKLRARKNWDEL